MSKRQITSGVVGLLVAAITSITVTAQTKADAQRKRPQLVVGIVVEGLTTCCAPISPRVASNAFSNRE